jgi:integrase/recombinase XerC
MPEEVAASGPHPILDAFLSHLAHERRLSRHTVQNYARDVRVLLELAGTTALGDIHPNLARRFVAQLHARGLNGKSLARTLSAWRTLYRYLARDHGVTRNPFEGVRAPKSAKTLPKALSPDEASRLMQIGGDEALSVRDRAMFELFYSSGLRLAELVGLTLPDLDFDQGLVRVTGKGGKARVVPVGGFALDAIRGWLRQRNGLASPEQTALFLTARGTPLGPRAIQTRLRNWAVRQGLSQPVHPHMLRHSFASHVLQSSGDLRAVQEMLGHASISTTQVYTHLDFQHLAKAYDAAHPRAKRKTATAPAQSARGGGATRTGPRQRKPSGNQR